VVTTLTGRERATAEDAGVRIVLERDRGHAVVVRLEARVLDHPGVEV
jgi:hypothetical protein